MAWTNPTTQASATLIAASNWNTDIVNNLLYLSSVIEPSLYNRSGSTLPIGTPVIVASSNDDSYTTTSTENSGCVIGVVAESTASGALGRIIVSGPTLVSVSGSVARGNYLITSTSPLYAKDGGVYKTAGTFGITLMEYSGSGTGYATALMGVAAAGHNVPSNSVMWTTEGSAPSGFSSYTAASGRMIVGLPSGGTNLGTVGTALTNLQIKSHAHGSILEYPSHAHTIGYGTNEGAASGMRGGTTAGNLTTNDTAQGGLSDLTSIIMPYIQLLAIKKN